MYLFLAPKMMTPKEFLSSYVEKFNAGNVSFSENMYETDACFVVQPGQVVNGLENIRRSLLGFIDMNGNLESKVKGVIQTSNLFYQQGLFSTLSNEILLLLHPLLVLLPTQSLPLHTDSYYL
jgi:hypothetical protein